MTGISPLLSPGKTVMGSDTMGDVQLSLEEIVGEGGPR